MDADVDLVFWAQRVAARIYDVQFEIGEYEGVRQTQR